MLENGEFGMAAPGRKGMKNGLPAPDEAEAVRQEGTQTIL